MPAGMAETSMAVPTTAREGERTRVLASLTAIHTLNDFYGLVLPPLLPALRVAFDLSYTQMGVVPFVSTAVSAFLQPTLGYVADRRMARRGFLVAGFIGFALASLWLSTASSYPALLFAAALLGLAASTYHPQSATYLLYYFRDNRGFAQGIHGLGNGLGFMLAPLILGFVVQRAGWETAARVAAIPALIAIVLVLTTLREPPIQGGAGMFAGITRPLVLLTVVNGLSLSAQQGFVTFLPSYYAAQQYTLEQAGFLTTAMFAAGLVAQPAGGILSDRLGRRAVVTLSLIGLGAFLALFLASSWLPLMLAASLLVGFCGSLMPPVAMVYASELATGQRSGMAVGIVWGLGTAISSLAPLLAGRAIDLFGFGSAYAGLAVVAIVAAGLARLLPGR
jgi:FSR family fosmidomycin resistance protein-like MFS transporter